MPMHTNESQSMPMNANECQIKSMNVNTAKTIVDIDNTIHDSERKEIELIEFLEIAGFKYIETMIVDKEKRPPYFETIMAIASKE